MHRSRLVDLSHVIENSCPTWDGACGFRKEIVIDYDPSIQGATFRVERFALNAGIGTHMDAPAHCISGGMTIDQIPINRLYAPCIVIDVSHYAHAEYVLGVDVLEAFEQEHGSIPEYAFVCIATGWDRHWQTKDRYRNNLQFPSINREAAQFLLKRNINALGVDVLGPDLPRSVYPVHQLLLGNNIFIIENLTNLDQLPTIGSYLIVLPIKIDNGTEAPVRCIAVIPE